MTLLTPAQARVYVNHGRAVADCPVECGGAQTVVKGQATFACQVCKTFSSIEWPVNLDEILEVLEKRTNPKNRNWFPAGHYLALRGNMPHGQSVQDLLDEQEEYEWRGLLP